MIRSRSFAITYRRRTSCPNDTSNSVWTMKRKASTENYSSRRKSEAAEAGRELLDRPRKLQRRDRGNTSASSSDSSISRMGRKRSSLQCNKDENELPPQCICEMKILLQGQQKCIIQQALRLNFRRREPLLSKSALREVLSKIVKDTVETTKSIK